MIRFEIRARPGRWYFVLHVPGECPSVGEVLHGSKTEVEREIEAVRSHETALATRGGLGATTSLTSC